MKDGLSRHGARNRTNGGRTGKPSKAKQGGLGTDWKKLRHADAASIRKGIESDAEARPTNAEFWKDAKVIWPRGKTLVTMRLDADLLAWFRRGRGYQNRINAILRAYMKAHASDAPQSTPSKM
jgi:uncharacterized protein (DUF4415 family)